MSSCFLKIVADKGASLFIMKLALKRNLKKGYLFLLQYPCLYSVALSLFNLFPVKIRRLIGVILKQPVSAYEKTICTVYVNTPKAREIFKKLNKGSDYENFD